MNDIALLYPPNNEVVGGYIGFTPSVRPSVRLSFFQMQLHICAPNLVLAYIIFVSKKSLGLKNI